MAKPSTGRGKPRASSAVRGPALPRIPLPGAPWVVLAVDESDHHQTVTSCTTGPVGGLLRVHTVTKAGVGESVTMLDAEELRSVRAAFKGAKNA